MIARILYWLSGQLPCRLIYVDGQPYLERYFVARIGPFTAYLHRFISADGDRHLHDHPWRAVALVLSGGYTEERLVGLTAGEPITRTARRRPWWPNFLGLRSFHRIAHMQRGTWTLFIHGTRWKGWGFLEPADDAAHAPDTQAPTLTVYMPFVTHESHHQQGWHKRNPKGKHAGRERFDLKRRCDTHGHCWTFFRVSNTDTYVTGCARCYAIKTEHGLEVPSLKTREELMRQLQQKESVAP